MLPIGIDPDAYTPEFTCSFYGDKEVDAYLKKGFISLYRKWQLRYGLGIRVVPDQKLTYLEYHFFDKNGNEVDMKETTDIK